jgi:hypothetical protein
LQRKFMGRLHDWIIVGSAHERKPNR